MKSSVRRDILFAIMGAAPELNVPLAGNPIPANLDPYLDAAEKCFIRYGYAKATIPDIARTMNVSRATVYRNIGDMERIKRVYGRRELSRQMERVLTKVRTYSSVDLVEKLPEILVEALVDFAQAVYDHPVIQKLRTDEPRQLILLEQKTAKRFYQRGEQTVAPQLQRAMDAGALPQQDPGILAQGLLRLVVSIVVAPPSARFKEYIEEIVPPLLTAPASSVAEAA